MTIGRALELARLTVAELEAVEAAQPPAAPVPPPSPSSPPVPAQAAAAGLSNPAAFFDVLRASKVLGPTLEPGEVDGCNAILAACAGKMPTSWTAYALATAFLETAGTMQPISEYGGNAYFHRMYDIEGARPAKARELGNTSPGDGVRYHGRGLVQITGKGNYTKATKELRAAGFDVDLIAEPDLAKRPDVAAFIMVNGMRDGWFTGKGLRAYLPNSPTLANYTAARRIINGQDRAADVAGYAATFFRALEAGGWR